MERKKIAIMARLNDADGDLKKQWFIYYSFRNPTSGKLVRFRDYDGITGITKRERYKQADKRIIEINKRIRNGWSPFDDDDEAIYEDQIQYQHLVDKYNRYKARTPGANYYFNIFLDEWKPNITPATYTTYKSKLRLLFLWLKAKKLDDQAIECFDKQTARDFIKYLFDVRKLGNNSVKHYLSLLKMVFNNLIEKEVIINNPWERIKIARKPGVPAKYFNTNVMNKLREHLIDRDPQLWMVAEFEYYCFIRPKELRLLQVGDIDFEEGTIHIRGEISKNKKNQTILIPEPFLERLLQRKIDTYPMHFFIIGVKGYPSEKPVSRNFLSTRFRKHRYSLELSKEYKLYSFKHTGAVRASKVVPLKDLQMQLRHHSLDQVDFYLRQMKGTESEEIRRNFPEI